MNQPTVCAVMLTADRPELAKRAVESFRAQTYDNRRLLIWDSGKNDEIADITNSWDNETWVPDTHAHSIGELRNNAIHDDPLYNSDSTLYSPSDIIVHWDDDDYSHPARIAEQVALLQSSGAEAVGYNEMLFWREGCAQTQGAWIYRGTILGTSLCYWRSAWERRKFEATSYGEDTKWLQGVKSQGVPAFRESATITADAQSVLSSRVHTGPRMVARIHGNNTSKAYDVKSMLAAPNHWTRTPQWDDYCKSVME